MKMLINTLAIVGGIVVLLWAAGTADVGDFKLTYGPKKHAVSLTCLEFATADDQAVFNSTGIIRAGATVSNKSEQDCKGRLLAKVEFR